MLNITDISYTTIEERLALIDPEQIQFSVKDLAPMIFEGNFYCNVTEYRVEEWEWYSLSNRVEFHCSDSKKEVYCACQSSLNRDAAYLCDHIAQAIKTHYQAIFGYAPQLVEVSETVRQQINDIIFLQENFTSEQAARLVALRDRYQNSDTLNNWYLAT